MTAPSTPGPERPPELERPSRVGVAGLYVAGSVTVAAAAIAVFFVAGAHHRALADEVSTRQTALHLGPRVRVEKVGLTTGVRTVSLPGEVHAWAQTTLYAKVSGYLETISVDKGDRVQKGEAIGHLESPEIDQTVASATADVAFKKITAERGHDLLKSHFMAQQDVDTADAALKQSEATLASARAMQQYEWLRAPFAGVVTNRYADPGALLPAATASTQSAQPIIDISQLDRLRLQVYLGQDDAALVKVGDPARITMDQRPDVVVQARVSRVTNALDTRTRTMLAEIDLDNRKTNIYPGEFIHVDLVLRARPYPVVSADSLIYREQKLYVATILDNTAHIVAVQAGQDDGKTVQITSGLKGDELVAINAGSEVEDGAPVQPIEDAPVVPSR